MGAFGTVDADRIIEHLGLEPHPEGGYYRETWRHDPGDGSRGAGTAVYFLLKPGQRSHWHRVDADELWLFHLGAPVTLRIKDGDGAVVDHVLGADLVSGHEPQVLVPADAWQTAEAPDGVTLVTCTGSPAFRFEGFELAPPDWQP